MPYMLLRRAVGAVLALALAPPLLAACGDDGAEVATGDVIPAREAAQFDSGKRSLLLLPTGRLEVRLGDPTTEVARSDTRELEPLQAPEGHAFVPLTWHYDTDWFAVLQPYLGADEAPTVDLTTGGETYRLPTPADDGDGAESFYVLVDASTDEVADDLGLQAGFDGVDQSVDLHSGRRRAGAAKSLYDLPRRRADVEECGAGWFSDPNATADFECSYRGPVRLPYANGEWAKKGQQFVGIELSTAFSRYDVVDPAGTAAVYAVARVRTQFRAGGAAPATVLPSDGSDNVCPNETTLVCSYAARLIFDVADASADRLEVEQIYKLIIGKRYGAFPGAARTEVTARGTIPLD